MVLDEASPTSDTFVDESSPSSDRDAYSQDGAASTGVSTTVDYSSLPKPVPIFGPLAGYTHANRVQSIQAILRGHSLALQRPLTGPETQCIAYYFAKRDAIASYGTPIGAAAGMYWATRVHGQLKLPFYRLPEAQYSLQKFLSYRGARAEMMWRLTQKLLYTSVGAFWGKTFFVLYAVSVSVNGQRSDPRMKDIIENAISIGPKEAVRRAGGEGGEVTAMRGRQGQGQAENPQSEMDGYGGTSGMPSDSKSGVMNDQDMRRQEVRQQPDPARSPAQNQATTFQVEKVASQPAGFDFDDASPTAQRPQQSQQQSGNAWERLRSGQGPPPQPRQQQQGSSSRAPSTPPADNEGNAWARMRGDSGRSDQQSGSAGGDSFSYSSAEQDRQLAKEEAQREFDARIDRERQGKDFEESGNRRWK